MKVNFEPKKSILYKMMIDANVPMVNRSRLIMLSNMLPTSILSPYPVSALNRVKLTEY